MALKMHYDSGKLYRDAKRIEKAIVSRMQRIGEQFVSDARSQPQDGYYKDRTANLRSSIGYFILKDNIVIGGNVEGKSTGITAAKAALKDVPNRPGIRLVGVAGMNYAAAVESRGFNVITSQSIIAIDNLDVQLKVLAKKTGMKTDLLNNAEIF